MEQARVQKANEEAHKRFLHETQERNLREYQQWRLQHSALVDKFREITERKVSLLDDYDDENWDALSKEIETLLLKTAKADNDDINPMRILLFKGLKGEDFARAMRAAMQAKFRPGEDVGDWVTLLGKYKFLKSNLESEFRTFHESQKQARAGNPDFKTFSGADFEVYLAKVLKENGFEDVCGTSATRDQGSDLIAKKGNRKIVIQAKCWQGLVGNTAVQEVVGAVRFYGEDEGWVITNSTFTPDAKALAQKNNVKLIDGHSLRNKQLT